MNRSDKVSSLIWLVFSIAVIVGSSTYSFGRYSQPGAGFLPLWCGIIMATLSLCVIINAVLKDKKEAKGKEEGSLLTPFRPKLILALIILFAYAFLLETFGFLLMTFVFMLFILKLVEATKWRTAIAEALLASLASYAIFELWLKVPLPKCFIELRVFQFLL